MLYTKIKMVHIEFYQSVVILNKDSQLKVKVVVKVEMWYNTNIMVVIMMNGT